MSVVRGFGLNGKSLYSNVAKPMEVNLSFVVTPTNGLGITSLKSNGYVENVFMHTSTTPTSNNGHLNPNPAVGYAVIQLKNNFNKFLGLSGVILPPNTGSVKIDNGATLTLGQAYVITTLGNATATQWTTVGVPPGVTPAVGVSFIAIATGAGSGNTSTSRVSTPTVSSILSMQVIGNPDTMNNSSVAANSGAFILLQFAAPTDASTTTAIPAAPTAASTIDLKLLFDGSSVSVDGL